MKINICLSGLNFLKSVLPLKHEILSEYLARNNIEGGCFAPRKYSKTYTQEDNEEFIKCRLESYLVIFTATKHYVNQGNNARKVISEVYASFVLQCTVFGRKSKHKTDVTA